MPPCGLGMAIGMLTGPRPGMIVALVREAISMVRGSTFRGSRFSIRYSYFPIARRMVRVGGMSVKRPQAPLCERLRFARDAPFRRSRLRALERSASRERDYFFAREGERLSICA